MKKFITPFFLIAIIGFTASQSAIAERVKTTLQKTTIQKDTLKKSKNVVAVQPEAAKDTIAEKYGKLSPYKTNAHASYYADKFHGRKTASGALFNMHKYTAAHKKFPFGTMLKVTNQVNGKSVIVEVNDRGPFVKSREIDLSKKAFMEIAKNKGIGVMTVTIEVFSK
ncbi:rare lipoprotein A [Flavobacterium sp. 7E]|uniref:septal ring lytic transglycosylase RlpA family protein n=1 Tax=unclassified Flavobacterium TaxID=196869 RepID=UPI0015702632|nr:MULTISPECIES: septal ring lytic transglycosylase RlpA family protein [unclassified Flavobacterium]MBE0390664.1 RlpA-like protein [Flavobacterium sp. PL002]NRS88663.1 rare lipoprotein A [Flavobacterium sp. 7E]